VTRAKDPFLHASHLARGAHLNAVGAILPANAEFHQDVFDRVSMIGVDDVPSVQRASKEFIERYGAGGDWSAVRPIGAIIAEGKARPAGADVTLFKSMGMGVSDLSVALMVIERARARGIGQPIPHPVRAIPRWNPTAASAAQEATHE
jgi:ornithine cyclodeaminase